jgi:hypothetical protein
LKERYEEAVGLGGNSRQLGSGDQASKAVEAVRRAIYRTISTLNKATPPLAKLFAHLKAYIRQEGVTFMYDSPPDEPAWITRA